MEEMQAATVADNYLPAGYLIPRTPVSDDASPSQPTSEAQQPQPAATVQSAGSPQPQLEATSSSLPKAWDTFVKNADEKLAAWANPASMAADPAEGQGVSQKKGPKHEVQPVLDTMNEFNYWGFEHSTLRPEIKEFIEQVKGVLGEKWSSRLQAAWDLPQKLLARGTSMQAQMLSNEAAVPETVTELPKPHPGPPPAAPESPSETLPHENLETITIGMPDVIDVVESSETHAEAVRDREASEAMAYWVKDLEDATDAARQSQNRVSSSLSLMAGQRTIKSTTPMMTIFKTSTLMDDSITSIEIEVPGLTDDQRDPTQPRQAINPLQPASAHFRLSQIAGPQNRPGMHWEPEDSSSLGVPLKPQAEPYDGYWLEARPAMGATARITSDRAMPVTATYELQLVLGSITPTSKAVSGASCSHHLEDPASCHGGHVLPM